MFPVLVIFYSEIVPGTRLEPCLCSRFTVAIPTSPKPTNESTFVKICVYMWYICVPQGNVWKLKDILQYLIHIEIDHVCTNNSRSYFSRQLCSVVSQRKSRATSVSQDSFCQF